MVIETLPGNATLYYNGTPVTPGQVIAHYDPTKLTLDPTFDTAGTVTFTFAFEDAAGKVDPTPATATLTFVASVAIGDYVWHDANGNGIQDPGETGIANVALTLTGNTATGAAVTDHTTTGANGYYQFTEAPGTYQVSVDAANFSTGAPLEGYLLTSAGKGTPGTGSKPNPSGTTPAALTTGQSDETVDFGFTKSVTIGHFVWNDLNGNGVQDPGEPGLPSVTLTLRGTDLAGDLVTKTTTTDANGHYQFTVVPGTYTVTVTTPAGFTPTATGQGTPSTDSNTNPSATTPTTLTEGLSDQTIDFGFTLAPTLALLKSIRAYPQDGVVVVEWTTASEVDTLAFDLYRRVSSGAGTAKIVSWLPINDEPVLASDSITGSKYSVVDTTAAIPGTYTYQLMEWDLDGTLSEVGVYQLTVSDQPRFTKVESRTGQLLLEWQGGVAPYHLEQRSQLGGTEQWVEVPLADPNATTLQLPLVGTSGFYRISNAQ